MLMSLDSAATLKDGCFNARECLTEIFGSRRRPGNTYQGFVAARRKITDTVSPWLRDHLRAHIPGVSGKHGRCLG